MFNFIAPTTIISILIALSIHEWAHAYAAYKLGDPTAKYAGRLTINPISHLDPMGTILFFLVGFGWGKPVPIDPRYFKNERRDTAIVAAAGPFSNIVLALIAFFILQMIFTGTDDFIVTMMQGTKQPTSILQVLEEICRSSIFINISLMAFNLLPIAPLDGSKILRMFIPYQYSDTYEQFMQQGPTILLVLLLLDNFSGSSFLGSWIYGISKFILSVLLLLFS